MLARLPGKWSDRSSHFAGRMEDHLSTVRRGGVDLPLAADRTGPAPLTVQVVGQLRTAMADGRLAAGERLPSTRALAATLGISRTVVTGAYAQLFAEGWIEGRHGSGTYVADGTSVPDGACLADMGNGADGHAPHALTGHGRQAGERGGAGHPAGPVIDL